MKRLQDGLAAEKQCIEELNVLLRQQQASAAGAESRHKQELEQLQVCTGHGVVVRAEVVQAGTRLIGHALIFSTDHLCGMKASERQPFVLAEAFRKLQKSFMLYRPQVGQLPCAPLCSSLAFMCHGLQTELQEQQQQLSSTTAQLQSHQHQLAKALASLESLQSDLQQQLDLNAAAELSASDQQQKIEELSAQQQALQQQLQQAQQQLTTLRAQLQDEQAARAAAETREREALMKVSQAERVAAAAKEQFDSKKEEVMLFNAQAGQVGFYGWRLFELTQITAILPTLLCSLCISAIQTFSIPPVVSGCSWQSAAAGSTLQSYQLTLVTKLLCAYVCSCVFCVHNRSSSNLRNTVPRSSTSSTLFKPLHKHLQPCLLSSHLSRLACQQR